MAYDIGPFDGEGSQGVQRLLALADYLETVSDRDYDHCAWRRERGDGSWAMCALGHGVTGLPAAIGLRWRKPGSGDIVRLDGSGYTQSTLALAGEAFELTLAEAETIFGLGPHTVAFYRARAVSGIKPKLVSAALRRFAFDRMQEASSSSQRHDLSFAKAVLVAA